MRIRLSALSVMSIVLLGASSSVWAQVSRASKERELADIKAAQIFLLAAYPELGGRPVLTEIVPVGGSYAVRIVDAPSPGAKPADQVALISAVMTVDAAGQVTRYQATGVLLEEARNRALHQQLAAHPEWAESDAELYLQQISGRSSQEALGSLSTVTARSRAALGASVTLEGAPVMRWKGSASLNSGSSSVTRSGLSRSEFEPPPAPPGAPSLPATVVRPVWVVDATSQDATGATLRYRLEYEPISGRLVGAARQ